MSYLSVSRLAKVSYPASLPSSLVLIFFLGESGGILPAVDENTVHSHSGTELMLTGGFLTTGGGCAYGGWIDI